MHRLNRFRFGKPALLRRLEKETIKSNERERLRGEGEKYEEEEAKKKGNIRRMVRMLKNSLLSSIFFSILRKRRERSPDEEGYLPGVG